MISISNPPPPEKTGTAARENEEEGRTESFPHTPSPPSALSPRRAERRRNHSCRIFGEKGSNFVQESAQVFVSYNQAMLYTRKGDSGTTKDFKSGPGVRKSKSSCQTEALGALDELNSFLGLVKVKCAEIPRTISGKKFSDIVFLGAKLPLLHSGGDSRSR